MKLRKKKPFKLSLLVCLFNEDLPVLFRHLTDRSHAMKGHQSISVTHKDAHIYRASINVGQA